MLKKHENIFLFLQVFADSALVILSALSAYWFRFEFLPQGQEGLEIFLAKLTIALMLITLYFFHRYGLYRSQRFNKKSKEIIAILQANTFAVFASVLLLYFLGPGRVSRILLLSYLGISTSMFIIARMTIRNILRAARRKGYNLRHILLVGNGPQLLNYIETIDYYKDAGIKIIGWIDSMGQAQKHNIADISLPLEQAKKELRPDSIIIGHAGEQAYKTEQILKEGHNDVIPMQILPNLPYSFVGNTVDDFAGIPLISVNQPNFSPIDTALKRAFDLLSTGIGLLLISPLLMLIALGVKLTSKGPIFYAQKRMGLDGSEFKMWKFRSMRVATDQDSDGKMGWTTQNDPRKTAFGNILRKTSLDELPQVWNVFIGDMSLVGPRPEQPYWVDKFKNEIPMYMLRHKMKAGITGWAQINGLRGDTSISKRIEFDIYYIKNWSFWFDIKILFLTFWKGFFNKNAY